jgi:hypothetical protein
MKWQYTVVICTDTVVFYALEVEHAKFQLQDVMSEGPMGPTTDHGEAILPVVSLLLLPYHLLSSLV